MLRVLTPNVSLLQARQELLEDDKWLKGADGKHFGSALLHAVLRDTGSMKASITPAKLAFVVWRMFLTLCKEGAIATKTTKLPSTASSTESWYSELIPFVAANVGKHWATHQVEGGEPYTTLLSIVLPDPVCFASFCLELVR